MNEKTIEREILKHKEEIAKAYDNARYGYGNTRVSLIIKETEQGIESYVKTAQKDATPFPKLEENEIQLYTYVEPNEYQNKGDREWAREGGFVKQRGIDYFDNIRKGPKLPNI